MNLFVSKVPYISYRVEPMETCERKEEKNFINKYANNVIKQKRREKKKKEKWSSGYDDGLCFYGSRITLEEGKWKNEREKKKLDRATDAKQQITVDI